MSDAVETETASETGQGQRRMILVGALLVMFGALGVISFGSLDENLVYYWDCSQVVEAGEQAYGATIRLGGVVKEGSLDWDPERTNSIFKSQMARVPGCSCSRSPRRCSKGLVWLLKVQWLKQQVVDDSSLKD